MNDFVEVITLDNRVKQRLDKYFDDIYQEYLNEDLDKKLIIVISLCMMQSRIDDLVNGGHYG